MRWSVRLFAVLGGLFFNYDTGVINSVFFQMRNHFGFSEHLWKAGFIVSILPMCAFVGAFISGLLAFKCGRRVCVALADVLCILGYILMAVAPSVAAVLVGRVSVGLGIGICSVIIPVYLAEITPAESRGSVVVLARLCITGAQFIAAPTTALLVLHPSTNFGWRVAFGLGAVLALVQLIVLLFLPESPRWLNANGDLDRARKAVKELGVDDSFLANQREVEPLSMNYCELFGKDICRRLLIGCMLLVFQQIFGINAIVDHGVLFLSDAGFMDSNMLVSLSTPLAVINAIVTIVTLLTVDRWGRRPLLRMSVVGCFCVTVALTVVGFLLRAQVMDAIGLWVFLALLGVYLVFFAPGLGTMPWVVMGEIFPNRLRTPAASVATMCNWASNAVVALLFPIIMGAIGVGGTFSIICGCILCAVIFVYHFVPETKRRTLEEIEERLDESRAAEGGGSGNSPEAESPAVTDARKPIAP